MDSEEYRLLTERIDAEIEACQEQLEEDLIRMIGIKSVKGEPGPGAPFGPGPRQMLDEALRMGKDAGFLTRDYGVGVISMSLREGQPDLGIWLHGDVVPEGRGWEYPPYQAARYYDCIIGRGATDNKGQLAAVYNLLKIFRRMEIPLRYNPAIYVGSDEENGMHDLSGIPDHPDAPGFCNVCTPPRLSLVPDGSFPVCYGGKGGMNVVLRSVEPLRDLVIMAGPASDPGLAQAWTPAGSIAVKTPLRHPAHPDPDGNMITRLMERLLDTKCTDEDSHPVLDYFRRVSLDIHGDTLGIHIPSEHMTPTTVFCAHIKTEDGRPSMTMDIRYPIELTEEEILRRIAERAKPWGVCIASWEKKMDPYLLDPSSEVVLRLTDIANSVTGESKHPYTINGSTYAHRLPNALVFGMDGCRIPQGYPKGRGNAHGLDELVSIERLQRAMRIYARALLALNGMDW